MQLIWNNSWQQRKTILKVSFKNWRNLYRLSHLSWGIVRRCPLTSRWLTVPVRSPGGGSWNLYVTVPGTGSPTGTDLPECPWPGSSRLLLHCYIYHFYSSDWNICFGNMGKPVKVYYIICSITHKTDLGELQSQKASLARMFMNKNT